MPELIANRYRIDRPLAVGAAAFQAFDLQLGRTVVIKTLPTHRVQEAPFARQLYEEAASAARLSHPNLVGIYDVCANGAHALAEKPNGPAPFVVLEWVPGCDLQAYLASREPLPSEETDDPFERKLDFLIQVCRGLHYGHEQGLTHGSVNPENIRVTPVREAKILNFGITPSRQTGAWHYLSPEQLEGQTKPDRRSDVFSLGIILYELLFGVHPFCVETEEATRSRILTGEYRPVDDVLPGSSGQLTEIVNRALARNPNDRFVDCKLLELALKALRSRLGEEKEVCRARLLSLRAALKKGTQSQHPGQVRHFDLAVLESADPNSKDYEHLLRSCRELEAVIERLKAQAQIEKMLDSAETEANAGQFETGLALLAEVLRKDPGNARAVSLGTVMRRRQEVQNLLREARQAEAAHDVGMGCIIALQAVQLDPEASDAKAEFERMQAILRQGKEQERATLAPTKVRRAEKPVLDRPAPMLNQVRTRLFDSRLLAGVGSILFLLLVVGFVWVVSTRDGSGPSPVSARNVPAQAKPHAPSQATVFLDVVPWAKVDSIVDLKDGKPVAHEELETPCTFRLPEGRYAMTVSHPEFGSRLLQVEVKGGITNRVKLSLLSEPQLEKEVHRGGR